MRRHLALACVLAMSGGSAHAAVGVWTEVRENPFLLDVNPILGWQEGKADAEKFVDPAEATAGPNSGNSAGKNFLNNWQAKKRPRGSRP